MVFFLLVLMGVGERPEKHLVSMSLPHSRNDLVGSLPTLCPPLHALSKGDRSYDPYYSYPCCGVYGCRRAADGPIMTLTQVACQVARRRPCYTFVTGKVFSFLDHDPLRRMCVGLHRWVSQALLVSRSSTWVVTNPLSGDAIGGSLVLHHLRTCSLSYTSRGRVPIHLVLSRS